MQATDRPGIKRVALGALTALSLTLGSGLVPGVVAAQVRDSVLNTTFFSVVGEASEQDRYGRQCMTEVESYAQAENLSLLSANFAVAAPADVPEIRYTCSGRFRAR